MPNRYQWTVPFDMANSKMGSPTTFVLRKTTRGRHTTISCSAWALSLKRSISAGWLTLEHMAFNGTKHFPGKQLIGYLESNGVQFGTDINAYTAFDETVYSLSRVPTHRMGLVDSCLLILRDWSNDITLTAQEIDAERKVIHEEWRTKRNARDRIYEQTLPKLFPDSNRYAYRMPIGLMEVVDNFPTRLCATITVSGTDPTSRLSSLQEMWMPTM